MTLVMVLGNRDQVIQLADRRLTADGRVVAEDYGKSGSIFFADSRFTFGFTGIARARGVDVRRWILDTLLRSGPPDFTAAGTLSRFAQQATLDFSRLPHFRSLAPLSRRLSIIFLGYIYNQNPPLLAAGVVSNCQDFSTGKETLVAREEFVFSHTQEKQPRVENPTFIQHVGAMGLLSEADVAALREVLESRKPANAIVGMAGGKMLELADRSDAHGTVGRQLTWIRLPSDRAESVASGSYLSSPGPSDFLPSVIWCTPKGTGVVDYVSFTAVEETNARPKIPVVGRNSKCPCGSGKRYKKCHGSTGLLRAPGRKTPH
jgi:SEC-C motif